MANGKLLIANGEGKDANAREDGFFIHRSPFAIHHCGLSALGF